MRVDSRPSWFDIALAAALVVLAISEVTFNRALAPTGGSFPIEIAMAAAVAWRRAAPLLAATVIAVGSVADAAIGVSPADPAIPMMATVAIAYALVAHSPLRPAIIGSVILLIGTAAQVIVAGQNFGNLAFAYTFLAVIWAIGRLVRLRTAQAVRAEVQVERLRHEQAERVRAVSAAERARIARELHDVIAHSVSVMVVQAGAAQLVLRGDPAAAEEALGAVQSTGRQAIGELGQLLGVLREGGDELGLSPQPTLAELPALIAEGESTGVPTTLTTVGAPRPLPAGLELAIYRIVQEALTNTRKHAGGQAHAEVVLDYRADEIILDISDDGHAAAGRHGTVGRQGDAGGAGRQDGTGGAGRQDGTGGAARQDGTGGAARQDDTGGAARQGDTGGAARQDGTGGAARQDDTGGAARQGDTGGAARQGDAGGAARQDDRATPGDTGHGLVGMRERISNYGGTLTAGHTDTQGFRVHARIPVHSND